MTAEAATANAAGAARLLNAGNLSGAERLLKEALGADPDHPRAHALMALLLYRRGRLAQAVQQANVAIGLQPTSEAFRFKALALTRLNRRKAAVEAAEAAVHADPRCGKAAIVLAAALENAKQIKEARAAIERAMELEPGSDDYRANLGLFMLRRGDLTGAERVAAELGHGSDADSPQLLLGEIALLRRRPQEARDRALWLLSRDATNPGALRLLTQIKASKSVFLGLWWRYSMFVATKPLWFRVMVFCPIIFGMSAIINGSGQLLVIYLVISKSIFNRMLKKELKTVQLKKSF